jgi:hypothetical protein
VLPSGKTEAELNNSLTNSLKYTFLQKCL